MTEKQLKCVKEIEKLMTKINEIVVNHDLQSDFISIMAVGFIDHENIEVDEDGTEMAGMSLLSSFAVTDEEELDDLLSYCVESYRAEAKKNEPKEGTIDWWLKHFGDEGSVN